MQPFHRRHFSMALTWLKMYGFRLTALTYWPDINKWIQKIQCHIVKHIFVREITIVFQNCISVILCSCDFSSPRVKIRKHTNTNTHMHITNSKIRNICCLLYTLLDLVLHLSMCITLPFLASMTAWTIYKTITCLIKSFRPSDANTDQKTVPSLIKFVICHLFGTKPSSKSIIVHRYNWKRFI